MVASFREKAVTMSYVRLPGSGSDKEARASFCDLARGSNLAASVPVPQPLGIPRHLHKRPRNEDSTNEPNKRPCLDTTQNIVRPSVSLISKPVSVTVAPVEKGNNVITTTNAPNNEALKVIQKPNKFILIRNTEQYIKKLKEHNDSVRSENEALQKQITLLKQIFRDPKKHESFLRRFLPEH